MMAQDPRFEQNNDDFGTRSSTEDNTLEPFETVYENNGVESSHLYSPETYEMTSSLWNTPDVNEKSEFALLKEKLLQDFKNWLDTLEEERLHSYRKIEEEPVTSPDLNSFYRELTSLKQEVRLQSKANQSIGQSLQTLSTSLEDNLKDSIRDVANAVHDVKQQIPEARRDAQRVFALELVNIVEGLERSAACFSSVRIPTLLIGEAKKKELLKTLCQPSELLLSKALDSLQRLKIKPVASIGDPFDPACMRALGYTESNITASGAVSEICLQGYKLEEKLIRTSEVRVEK